MDYVLITIMCDVCFNDSTIKVTHEQLENEIIGTFHTCESCSLPEKVSMADEWYKKHKDEISKALWVLTKMDMNHHLTKELTDKHAKALDALDELYFQLSDEHKLLKMLHE